MNLTRCHLTFTSTLTAIALACGAPTEEATDSSNLIGGAPAVEGEWEATIWIGNCTAAKVGPRHILTAAHCVQHRTNNGNTGWATIRDGFQPGDTFTIRDGKTLSTSATFTRTVAITEIHPAYAAACSNGCPNNVVMLPNFPPDVAVIRTTTDLPTSIRTAEIDANPVSVNTAVTIMGYGCESFVGGPGGPTRLKFERLRTQFPQNIAQTFTYLATPGKQQNNTEASLCPGDSGGPVYRGWDSSNDNIVGVNAYYTFVNSGGVSYQNLHTNLASDNPHQVAQWLNGRLPAGQVLNL